MILFQGILYSQSEIDSLHYALSKTKIKTERIDIYESMGKYFYQEHNVDSSVYYFNKAISILHPSEKIQRAELLIKIAKVYRQDEQIPLSLNYFQMANKLYELTPTEPDKKADLLKDIGRSYYDLAQYDSAMTYYMSAKEIYETNQIYNEDFGVLYHYIGSVYKRQGKMDQACDYYTQQIEYGEKHHMLEIIAEGTYLKATCSESPEENLQYDLKALSIYQELNDQRMLTLMYNNIAATYLEMGKLDSAIYYQEMNLKYERESGSKSHLAFSLANMSGLLIDKGRFSEAKKLLFEAEEIAQQTEVKKYITLARIYDEFFSLYYAEKNYKEAIDYLQLFYSYQDSAMDQEHLNAIHEMELAYETEKKESEIAQLELANKQEQYKKELAEADASQQATTKKVYMISGLLVLVLLIFAVYKWIESNRQKKIIFAQKNEVELQKALVDEKNKDIIDSMTYASSIQQAIITSEEYIRKMFPEFFVVYKPRDIVSGDFYWAYQTEDGKKLIAVGDCTGHGVPGAMMSMLGSAFLNELVIEGNCRKPDEILNKLRDHVKKALSHKEGKDGMDISICCIENNQLTFAGANLPVYVIRDNELIEIKGDKQPVGYMPGPETPFTARTIDIYKNDKIYLFSDGYADQFGGPKGKKYKYKSFQEKLIALATINFSKQRQLIDSEFETWKGDLEQLDDVCVLGISI